MGVFVQLRVLLALLFSSVVALAQDVAPSAEKRDVMGEVVNQILAMAREPALRLRIAPVFSSNRPTTFRAMEAVSDVALSENIQVPLQSIPASGSTRDTVNLFMGTKNLTAQLRAQTNSQQVLEVSLSFQKNQSPARVNINVGTAQTKFFVLDLERVTFDVVGLFTGSGEVTISGGCQAIQTVVDTSAPPGRRLNKCYQPKCTFRAQYAANGDVTFTPEYDSYTVEPVACPAGLQ
jgi:hypothetical protein